MTGRSFFDKYKGIIKMLEILSVLIPKRLYSLLWDLVSITESKAALLLRYLYVKKYARMCGVNIFIGKYVTIKNIQNLTLKDNISIHAYTYIDSYGDIEIKSNTSIANHCSLISFNHTYENLEIPIKYNKVEAGKITIEEDVWIGNGVRILPNVTINSRSIIAAGAVVNKDVNSNKIVGGIPAKVIKDI